MCSSACSGNDHPESPFLCFFGVLDHAQRGTMGRNNSDFMWYAELFQDIRRSFHDREIAVASHNDADQRIHKMICSKIGNKKDTGCWILDTRGWKFEVGG